MKVRTRFAPSPTGYFHIAGLQKVLYSYALAKKHGGQYVLRIEDTDRNRYVDDAEEVIFDAHTNIGVQIDESPKNPAKYGPYRQSERLDLYKEYAQVLIEKGFAYYAFETKEELEKMREAQKLEGSRPKYNGQYRDYPLEDAKKRVEAGEDYVIRVKMPLDEKIEIDDMIMGKITFDTNDCDDYILMKSDGYPTYHLAVVVDDHLMEITHIFRGVEWISTAPVHVLLYKYFGWKMPFIAHIPNILDPKGGKLSKRNGSVALSEFFEQGYLKEAIINFIILLGWSAPIQRVHGQKERELFSLEEFIELFDTKDLNKNNPIFNRQKLLWFNKEYLKLMNTEALTARFVEWLNKFSREVELKQKFLEDKKLSFKLELVKQRATLLNEVPSMLKFFYDAPLSINWGVKQLSSVESSKIPEIKLSISKLFSTFSENADKWIHEEWETKMRAIADEFGIKHADAFMVLRIAITGESFSPPLFECSQILGKEEVVKRLSN